MRNGEALWRERLEEKGEGRKEVEGACECEMALIYLFDVSQMQLAGHRGWPRNWSHMCWCWYQTGPSEYRKGSVQGCGRVLGTKDQRVRLGCEAPLPAGSRYLAPSGRGTHRRQEALGSSWANGRATVWRSGEKEENEESEMGPIVTRQFS